MDLYQKVNLDWVCSSLSTNILWANREVDTETLEVDDDDEDQDSGKEVGQVGEVGAVECLTESTNLVWAGDQKVEESNDGSFEFLSCEKRKSELNVRNENDCVFLKRE